MKEALLHEGEQLERLDLRGWIVASRLLKEGDEVVIEDDCLFAIPVRARITGISSNNQVAIDLLTEGARDWDGTPWTMGPQFGWFNVLWRMWKVVRRV